MQNQPALSIRKGVSLAKDPKVAAKELFAAIDQPNISLAIFYCSPDYDLSALATELNQTFKGINLIGCTTAGEITPTGYASGSLTGVSIAGELITQTSFFPLDSFQINHELALQQTLTILEKRGKAADRNNTFGFLLIDGLSMQEEKVVSSIHRQLRGIQLFGGSAGDETNFSKTYIYHAGRFYQNAAIFTLIQTPLPFIVFRTQHFEQSDIKMVVTRADPNHRIVHEINGEPASHEFARLLGLKPEELTALVFATHPVVVKVGGEYFIRAIQKANDDSSLSFFCAIDEGIVLTIANALDLVENLRQAFNDIRTRIGTPSLIIGCDCILRRIEMEQHNVKDQVGKLLADNNVIGFATYGEQFNAMHVSQTFTGVAIGVGNGA